MTNPPTYNSRLQALETLIAIQQGKSLSQLLDPVLNKLTADEKGFTHALILTTLRHWHAQSRLIDSLADKPIDEISVRTAIHIGLTQLLYMNVADHAAIHETVETLKHLHLTRATGIVNAILRKVSKNPHKFRKKCDKNHSLPNWLAKMLKQDWSDEYDNLTQALRQPAPIFLRVNGTQNSNDDYLRQLNQAELQADIYQFNTTLLTKLTDHNPITSTTQQLSPIILKSQIAIPQLPNFAQGAVSVQDANAQLATPIIHAQIKEQLLSIASQTTKANPLTADKNDLRTAQPLQLLDACTAPGGKLAHWLELLQNELINADKKFHVKQPYPFQLTAIDNEKKRIEKIYDNLQRLNFCDDILKQTNILCADATNWQNPTKQPFDAILLDAPCTATGVIRRHPDINLLRTEKDVIQTLELQAKILDNLWQQLKVEGCLLYITCSILKAENEQQMLAFLQRHDNATEIYIDGNWGIHQKIGRQCLPLTDNSGDGFYFALLKKTHQI